VEACFYDVLSLRRGVDALVALLPDPVQVARLEASISRLRGAPQEHFCIPARLARLGAERCSHWVAAVFELRETERAVTPSAKLGAVTAAAKTVFSLYAHAEAAEMEANTNSMRAAVPNHTATPTEHVTTAPSVASLGADEFFPVFVYVLVHAELTSPLALQHFLWAAADPRELQGQGGYFLTVLQAACTWLMEAPPYKP
jgi:hypothetical protein